MTIKAKLIANVLITAAIVAALSLSSFFSMRFLQEKLAYLTEKSTPFQIRTIEFQRELEGCLTSLVKVNAARSLPEYTTFRAEAEKKLSRVEHAQKSLETMGDSTLGVSNELGAIARELLAASEERINSTNAASLANAKMSQHMQESSSRLKELDTTIRTLQADRTRAFAKALANTTQFAGRLRSLEDLHDRTKDLQQTALAVHSAQTGSAIVIAKGRLNALLGRIAKNEHLKSDKECATLTTAVTDNLDEYIKLQAASLTSKDNTPKNKAEESGRVLASKLRDLLISVDQETEMAAQQLEKETGTQGEIFNQATEANTILLTNSELVALGLMVTGEINRLATLESVAELEELDSEIHQHFNKIGALVLTMESSLAKLKATKELKILHAATASLDTYSNDGIVTALKKKLRAIEQATTSADKLHAIVIKQSAIGEKGVSTAQGEQEKSIIEVSSTIRRSLAQIIGIGTVAIVLGILFGFWIFRSVLPPLRLVLDAADRVAAGDLAGDIPMAENREDEIGLLLRSLNKMLSALRENRDHMQRQDWLKTGIARLNDVMRGNPDLTTLAAKVISEISTYLDAKVGVLYVAQEGNDGTLELMGSYAYAKREHLPQVFKPGEGLVGQAALKKERISIENVPKDYIEVTSGLGERVPRFICISPFMYEGRIKGVIEVGTLDEMTVQQMAYLNQAMPALALAVESAEGRSRLAKYSTPLP